MKREVNIVVGHGRNDVGIADCFIVSTVYYILIPGDEPNQSLDVLNVPCALFFT